MIPSTKVRHCKTDKGTEYTIEEWICPICKKEKSTLIIDDELCHGDGEGARFYNGGIVEGCVSCVLGNYDEDKDND